MTVSLTENIPLQIAWTPLDHDHLDMIAQVSTTSPESRNPLIAYPHTSLRCLNGSIDGGNSKEISKSDKTVELFTHRAHCPYCFVSDHIIAYIILKIGEPTPRATLPGKLSIFGWSAVRREPMV